MIDQDERRQHAATEADIGFPGGRSVDVREVDDRDWRVLRAFVYQAAHEQYVVPSGEKTDFASVPRAFVWFIPTYGRYTKAAILHDHLCGLAHEGRFSRRDADGVFRQAMRTEGVPFLRRWIMWAAVRWGALGSADGRIGWLHDAWRVVPISVLVLPILLPAAVVVLVTLLVWHGIELVVWVPLALAARLQAKRRRPAKRVNRPRLELRT